MTRDGWKSTGSRLAIAAVLAAGLAASPTGFGNIAEPSGDARAQSLDADVGADIGGDGASVGADVGADIGGADVDASAGADVGGGGVGADVGADVGGGDGSGDDGGDDGGGGDGGDGDGGSAGGGNGGSAGGGDGDDDGGSAGGGDGDDDGGSAGAGGGGAGNGGSGGGGGGAGATDSGGTAESAAGPEGGASDAAPAAGVAARTTGDGDPLRTEPDPHRYFRAMNLETTAFQYYRDAAEREDLGAAGDALAQATHRPVTVDLVQYVNRELEVRTGLTAPQIAAAANDHPFPELSGTIDSAADDLQAGEPVH